MTTPSIALSFEFDAATLAKKERIRVSISTPYPKATGEWACLFELAGAKDEDEKREYFGADGFQALVLTLFYLRSLLSRLRKKGCAILDPESGDPFYPETYFDVFTKPA